MDLLARLKNSIKDSYSITQPEIEFLENTNLCMILNKGFSELYKARPEKPIKFLSKWLLKESKSKELAHRYEEERAKREKIKIKFIQKEKEKEKIKKQKEKKLKQNESKKQDLIDKIKNCNDYWKNFSSFCEQLKVLTNSTGVYLAIYDMKRREVTEEDDETGHIHPSNMKVLRYIAWCDDHSFLHGKCLEPNEGVTYTLFQAPPVQPQEQKEGDGNENNPPIEQKKPVEVDPDEIPTLLVDDVIQDPKIKFYREPRLGCYLALDITYKTSLSYNSLLSSIKCLNEFQKNKGEQEGRYKEWKEEREKIEKEIEEAKNELARQEEEKKQKEEEEKEKEKEKEKEEMKENEEEKKEEREEKKKEENENENEKEGEEKQPAQQNAQGNNDEQGEQVDIQALEAMLKDWTEEPVKLADFTKDEKKLILCLDTLGQNRIFSKEEIEYVKQVAKTIQVSIQDYEQKLLEKDRDIRVEFNTKENEFRTGENFQEERFEELVQKAIDDYYNSNEFKEKNITDEKLKEIEGDVARAKILSGIIFKGKIFEILLTFSDFEFVEYSTIFQSLFYFAHSDPITINEPETNKLDWKRARTHWREIFPYFLSFQPRGPKPDKVRNIYKLNKIKEVLEFAIAKREEVKTYSFCLLLLVDYILLLIHIRYEDIVQRTNTVLAKQEERERIIKKNEEIEVERNKIIEEANSLKAQKEPAEQQNLPQVEGEGQGEKPKEEQKEKPKEEQKEKPIEEQKEKTKEEQAQPPQVEEHKEEAVEQNQEEEFDLEKVLANFDAENPKEEVPPEIDFDLDLDYDMPK